MIKALLDNIVEILEDIDSISAVYDFNVSNLTTYPCAIVMPTSFNNEYLTNTENLKGYAFKIYIYQESVINNKQVSFKDIFLPVVDDVIAELDNKWDGNIWTGQSGSHRIWASCEGGDVGITKTEQGDLLYAELRLIINLTNNI